MKLGRKRYRKPVSFLKYINPNGIVENYQLTKQGFKRLDSILNSIPKEGFHENTSQQLILIEPNLSRSDDEINLNKQVNISMNQENIGNFNGNLNHPTSYFSEKYNLHIGSGEIANPINNGKALMNNSNNYSINTSYHNNSNSSQSSMSSNEMDLSSSQGTNVGNIIINDSTNSNVNDSGNQINMPDQSFNSQFNFSAQQSFERNFDQTLYDKIMNDKLTLILKECHLVKPDEVIVLYKIVPE